MEPTQRTICETMLKLMREKPMDKIKVTEVTALAGISRSTFYSYYDSIYSVVQDIEDDFIAHFAEEKQVGLKRDEAMILQNFSYVRDNIETFDILSGPNGDPYFNVRLGNRLKRVFYKIAEEHHSQLTDTQIAVICEFSRAGKMQAFHWWHDHKDEVSVKEIIEIISHIEQVIDDMVLGKS